MNRKSTFFTMLFTLIIGVTGFSQVPDRAGWWKFDNPSDLSKAETGTPLMIVGSAQSVDGPVAGNGAVRLDVGNYLLMTHNIAANGGGSMVNEYTIQIDFSVPQGGIWHAFFQTDLANEGDADLFSNVANSIGVAATGYTAKGISPDTWYRMIVSVKNGTFFKVYIDGLLWLEGVPQDIDGRFGLDAKLLMFADNDGEDGAITCSELGIWDFALDETQALSLGGATGERVPERTKMGWWKFDDLDNLLKAEIGGPLELVGSQTQVDGPEQDNKAVKLDVGSYLKINPNILPNGGGAMVNEYSLMIDFALPEVGKWHAFYQTDETNLSDADLFTNTSNNIGTMATTYTTDEVEANTWYRMVISVKNGEFFRIYVNGEFWLEGNPQDIDGRFAFSDVLLMFADNDGEDETILCSELAIWEVALNDQEIADLGGDPSNKLPEKMGMWKFDDYRDLSKATIGQDLVIKGTVTPVNGPANDNSAAEIGLGSYFEMTHGMYGNGDGYMVNNYTLQIDFLIPEGGIWHAFYQTDPNNASDADLFTNKTNNIGTAATTYSTESVVPNVWYRMVIVVKNGYFFKIYINGQPILNAAGQPVDGRFALANSLLLFADDDGDDGLIRCSEISIWDVALTDEQVIKLGDATTIPTGIKDIQVDEINDLSQNFPNPFKGTTTFNYMIREAGNVSFRLMDITGREIKEINEGIKQAGFYSLRLNSANLKEGIYFMQMKTGKNTFTRKMVIGK